MDHNNISSTRIVRDIQQLVLLKTQQLFSNFYTIYLIDNLNHTEYVEKLFVEALAMNESFSYRHKSNISSNSSWRTGSLDNPFACFLKTLSLICVSCLKLYEFRMIGTQDFICCTQLCSTSRWDFWRIEIPSTLSYRSYAEKRLKQSERCHEPVLLLLPQFYNVYR